LAADERPHLVHLHFQYFSDHHRRNSALSTGYHGGSHLVERRRFFGGYSSPSSDCLEHTSGIANAAAIERHIDYLLLDL
jgi:hypothetical protein